jgi:hypothetical protein
LKEHKAQHRISSENVLLAQQVLETAAVLIDLGHSIEAQTQRKAFATLMPLVRDLRGKGHTWEKITHHLNQSGFDIKTSTVRSYFVSRGVKNGL